MALLRGGAVPKNLRSSQRIYSSRDPANETTRHVCSGSPATCCQSAGTCPRAKPGDRLPVHGDNLALRHPEKRRTLDLPSGLTMGPRPATTATSLSVGAPTRAWQATSQPECRPTHGLRHRGQHQTFGIHAHHSSRVATATSNPARPHSAMVRRICSTATGIQPGPARDRGDTAGGSGYRSPSAYKISGHSVAGHGSSATSAGRRSTTFGGGVVLERTEQDGTVN